MPKLRLVPPRRNKLQLYYPFDELQLARLEAARLEAAADVDRDNLRHRAVQLALGGILVAATILGVVYIR